MLEVKRNHEAGNWHPHLHLVAQGKFIDHAKLKAAWQHVTKDSHHVDVRMIRDSKKTLDYVMKYASKPFDPSIFTDTPTTVECVTALKNVRMIVPYGTWKGIKLTAQVDPNEWKRICTLDDLVSAAGAGNLKAERILRKLVPTQADTLMALFTTSHRREGPQLLDFELDIDLPMMTDA